MSVRRLSLLLRLAVVHSLAARVDQLLVMRGLVTNRAAAKVAIQRGCVTTKRGVVLRKPAASIDEDTVLVLIESAGAAAESEEEAPVPRSPAPDLVEACDEPSVEPADPLVPVVAQAKKRSAASRASAFRQKFADPLAGAFGVQNENGLQGRGKSVGEGALRHKRYSKKNKRGTSHYHEV